MNNVSNTCTCVCVACNGGAAMLKYDWLFKITLVIMLILIILDVYHIWLRCNDRKKRTALRRTLGGATDGKTTV